MTFPHNKYQSRNARFDFVKIDYIQRSVTPIPLSLGNLGDIINLIEYRCPGYRVELCSASEYGFTIIRPNNTQFDIRFSSGVSLNVNREIRTYYDIQNLDPKTRDMNIVRPDNYYDIDTIDNKFIELTPRYLNIYDPDNVHTIRPTVYEYNAIYKSFATITKISPKIDSDMPFEQYSSFKNWIIDNRKKFVGTSLALKVAKDILQDDKFPETSPLEMLSYLFWLEEVSHAKHSCTEKFVTIYDQYEQDTFGTQNFAKSVARCFSCSKIVDNFHRVGGGDYPRHCDGFQRECRDTWKKDVVQCGCICDECEEMKTKCSKHWTVVSETTECECVREKKNIKVLQEKISVHLPEPFVPDENDYNNFYDSFKRHYPSNIPAQLEYCAKSSEYQNLSITFKMSLVVGDPPEEPPHEILVSFIMDKSQTNCHHMCPRSKGCYWSIVEGIKLSKINEHDQDEDYQIDARTADHITLELYPFERGGELTIPQLGYAADKLVSFGESFGYMTEHETENTHKIGDNLFITIDDDETAASYSVFSQYGDTKNVVAEFRDASYQFQRGDFRTEFFKYENDLIIDNRGNIASVVIIKGVYL